MDNLNIHGPKALLDYFGNEKGTELWNRFTVHKTPKHGNWLNQAENARVNHDRVTINWRFTRKKARQKFAYKPLKTTRFKRSEA